MASAEKRASFQDRRKRHKSRREEMKIGGWKTKEKDRRPPPKDITLW
jgi:hypothetical protein